MRRVLAIGAGCVTTLALYNFAGWNWWIASGAGVAVLLVLHPLIGALFEPSPRTR
jgi:hypothetical protein